LENKSSLGDANKSGIETDSSMITENKVSMLTNMFENKTLSKN